MTRAPHILGAACVALALGSCNNDNNTPTTGVQSAAISVTATPNPITTVQTSPAGPTWGVRYTVQLKESAGLGGKIEQLTGSLFDDASGVLISRSNYDDRDLLVFVGENRVEPNGTLDVPQDLSYVATGKRPTSVVIGVRFRDDKGNLLEPSLLVKAN